MTSMQYNLIYFMMKNRHLLQLKLKPEAWDENTSIDAFRQVAIKGNERMAKMPEGIEVQPLSIERRPGSNAGPMYAEWIVPAQAPQEKVILYMAGGGYVSGSCRDHRAMVAKVAHGSGIRTLLFDHRLAPEDPFPAPLEDAVDAYQWLLAQGYQPENMMIVGESAGGGLALATLLALKDLSIPLPTAAVALSPWTDLALTGESYRTKAGVCISPPRMAQVCSHYYVGSNDPCNPWISPLYGDLHNLPPLLIMVGDYETMRDDSVRFAAKARSAGVDVTLRVGERMIHCYPLMAPLFPEATQALEEMCVFIKAHLSSSK